MSGKKQLEKACRSKRVVAVPSKKKEIVTKDNNGVPLKDKNGEVIFEKIQLYNIYKLH